MNLATINHLKPDWELLDKVDPDFIEGLTSEKLATLMGFDRPVQMTFEYPPCALFFKPAPKVQP